MADVRTCATCEWFVEETSRTGEWTHEEALRLGKGFCLTKDLFTVTAMNDPVCGEYKNDGRFPVVQAPARGKKNSITCEFAAAGKRRTRLSLTKAAEYTGLSERRILWCMRTGRRWKGWQFSQG